MFINNLHNYTTIPRIEIDGKRYYSTPGGPLPSVTTILHYTSDNSHLDEWKTRVR